MNAEPAELHLSKAELEAGLGPVRQSPRDAGRLDMIVVRPVSGERVVLTECDADPERGVHGDRWVDGSRTPGTDVTFMNSRAAALIARHQERWPLAGDQLYVDFDISEDHLPPGTRVRIGALLFEITDKDHTGCMKFWARFGADAFKFVNSPEGAQLNLRGIYAKVVEGGRLRVGDSIEKVLPT